MRLRKIFSVLLSWVLWAGTGTPLSAQTGFEIMQNAKIRNDLKRMRRERVSREKSLSQRTAAKEKEIHEAPIRRRLEERANAPATMGGNGDVLYTSIAGTKIKAHGDQNYDPMLEMTLLDQDFENNLDSQGQLQQIHEAEKEVAPGKKTTLEQFHKKFSEFIAKGAKDPKVRAALKTPQGKLLLKKHKKMTSYLTMSNEFDDCISADKQYKLFGLLEMYDSNFLNLEDRYRALISQVDVADVSVECAISHSQSILDDGMFGKNGFAEKLMNHVASQTDKQIHDEMMEKSLENASSAYANFRAAYDHDWLKDIVESDEFAAPKESVDWSDEKFEQYMVDQRLKMARKIRGEISSADMKDICTDAEGKNICRGKNYYHKEKINKHIVNALKGSLLPLEHNGKPLKGYDPLSFHKQNRKRAESIADDLGDEMETLNDKIEEINTLTTGTNFSANPFNRLKLWTSYSGAKKYSDFSDEDFERSDVLQEVKLTVEEAENMAKSEGKSLSSRDKDEIVKQIYDKKFAEYDARYKKILTQPGKDGGPGLGSLMLAPALKKGSAIRSDDNAYGDKEYVGDSSTTTFKFHDERVTTDAVADAVDHKTGVPSLIKGNIQKLLKKQKELEEEEKKKSYTRTSGVGYGGGTMPYYDASNATYTTVNPGKVQLKKNLKFLLLNNPRAAAQILVEHPEYTKRFCSLLNEIYKDENWRQGVDNSFIYGGMAVGIAAIALTGGAAAVGWAGGSAAFVGTTAALQAAAVKAQVVAGVVGGAELLHWNNRQKEYQRDMLTLEEAFVAGNADADAVTDLASKFKKRMESATFDMYAAGLGVAVDVGALMHTAGVFRAIGKAGSMASKTKAFEKAMGMVNNLRNLAIEQQAARAITTIFKVGTYPARLVFGPLFRAAAKGGNWSRRMVATILNEVAKKINKFRGRPGQGIAFLERIMAETVANMVEARRITTADMLRLIGPLGDEGRAFFKSVLPNDYAALKMLDRVDNAADLGKSEAFARLVKPNGRGLLQDAGPARGLYFDYFKNNDGKFLKDLVYYESTGGLKNFAKQLAGDDPKKVEQTLDALHTLLRGKDPKKLAVLSKDLENMSPKDLRNLQSALGDANSTYRSAFDSNLAKEVEEVSRLALKTPGASPLNKRIMYSLADGTEKADSPLSRSFWKNAKNSGKTDQDIAKYLDANLKANRIAPVEAYRILKQAEANGFDGVVDIMKGMDGNTAKVAAIVNADASRGVKFTDRAFRMPGSDEFRPMREIVNSDMVKNQDIPKLSKFIEQGISENSLPILEAGQDASQSYVFLKALKDSKGIDMTDELRKMGERGSYTRKVANAFADALEKGTDPKDFAVTAKKAFGNEMAGRTPALEDAMNDLPIDYRAPRDSSVNDIKFSMKNADGGTDEMSLAELGNKMKDPDFAKQLSDMDTHSIAKGFGLELEADDVQRMIGYKGITGKWKGGDPFYQGVLNDVVNDSKLLDSIPEAERAAAKLLLEQGKGYQLLHKYDKNTAAVVLGILKQLEGTENAADAAKASFKLTNPWTWFAKDGGDGLSSRTAKRFLDDIWNKCK